MQERLATNAVYIFESRGQIVAECRSTQNVALRGGSMISASMPKVPGVAVLSSQITLNLPQLRGGLPLGTVMVALGVQSPEAMVGLCMQGRLLAAGEELLALEARRADFSPEGRARAEAVVQAAWLRGGDQAIDVLEYMMREVVPHVPTIELKARFLGYMVWRMLAVRDGLLAPDDRDDYANKRIDLAGVLMAQLFRQLYKRVRAELRSQLSRCLDKYPTQGVRAVNPRLIAPNSELATKGFKYSLSTGTWAVQGTPSARQCVSQVLNRLNYYATLSHLRRINSPSGREGKLTQPRQIHNTTWGLICPAETPEGQPVGLVKNMAILAHVTVGYEEEFLLEQLHRMDDWHAPDQDHGSTGVPVLVNGTHVGRCAGVGVVERVRRLRRHGSLSWETSVVHVAQDNAVHIHTDGGRLCRPLLIVLPDGSVPAVRAAGGCPDSMDFDAAVTTGCVDYLDVLEQSGSQIAMTPADIRPGETTHCEVHPSSVLGVCASLIPHAPHNQVSG